MGGAIDKISFIQRRGDPNADTDITITRSDVVYIKVDKTIILTDIMICRPVKEAVNGSLSIIQVAGGKELHNQTFIIDPKETKTSDNILLNYPVKIKGGQYYAIDVELSGGPITSYLSCYESVSHDRISVEISRTGPSKTQRMSKVFTPGQLEVRSSSTNENDSPQSGKRKHKNSPKVTDSPKSASSPQVRLGRLSIGSPSGRTPKNVKVLDKPKVNFICGFHFRKTVEGFCF